MLAFGTVQSETARLVKGSQAEEAEVYHRVMTRTLRAVVIAVLFVGLTVLAGDAQQRTTGTPSQSTGQPPSGQSQPQAPDPGQQPPSPPTFTTGINFVRVDVIITDKSGNPVSDL